MYQLAEIRWSGCESVQPVYRWPTAIVLCCFSVVDGDDENDSVKT